MTNGTGADNTGPDSCPRDELVVAYLTAGLLEHERQRIDAHLHTCDRCVTTVAMVQRRLRLDDEIAAPVPMSVADRVRGLSPAVVRRTGVAAPSDWRVAARTWLGSLFRLPVLVPGALATAMLLYVVAQVGGPTGTGATRGVSLPEDQNLRITAREVAVHAQPSTHAEVLATVARGTTVERRGEKQEWYRVRLPDGKEGWVEREAFE